MDRIVHPSAVDIGGGRRGFRSKDTVAGVAGTVVTATHMNGGQEEIVGLIEKAGLVPDGDRLDQLLRALRRGTLDFVVAGGTANALTATFDPAPLAGEFTEGTRLLVKIVATNTGAATFNGDPILNLTGGALVAGDLVPGYALLLRNAGGAWLIVAGMPSVIRVALNNFVIIADQKASGTNGGDFLAGAWQTRDLNTIIADPNGLVGAGQVALAANRVTLAAGAWVVQASAPAVAVNSHKSRFRNVTDNVTVLDGTSEQTTQNTNTDQIATRSLVVGRLTLAASKSFELQHICEQSSTAFSSGVGFGIGNSFIGGVGPETFSIVEIKKVG